MAFFVASCEVPKVDFSFEVAEDVRHSADVNFDSGMPWERYDANGFDSRQRLRTEDYNTVITQATSRRISTPIDDISFLEQQGERRSHNEREGQLKLSPRRSCDVHQAIFHWLVTGKLW